MSRNTHEQFDRPEPILPSDRSTGLVFTAVSLIIALIWRTNDVVFYIALAIAAVLLFISLVVPKLLHPINIAWMRFAHLLSKVMNPIVMMVLFAIVIVPAGLLMQLCRDPLRRKRQADQKSYWIEREPDERSSMTNQF